MRTRRLLFTLAAFVMVLSACTPSPGDDSSSAVALAANPSCVPTGKVSAQGHDAVNRLGSDIDAAAERIDMTPVELRETLIEDSSARIDQCGALYFEEPVVPADSSGPQGAPLPQAAVLPYSSTFTLHSRPGALRTIYLDFDGHRLEGTGWNESYNDGAGWDLLPYDSDGNGASFSNAEQDIIQDVWRRVSEDFAPFDIDVTTQDPGYDAIDRSSDDDTRYGTRAVVTDDAVIASLCDCGGIAYIGVYDGWPGSSHSYYQPALMFANSLSDGTSSKTIAEATSHEVGHNLGLNHDGTSSQDYYEGAGAWAPIMGTGYGQPVTQFSKGEYTGANNTEDDFSIIAANGGTPRSDDHADVRASATALSALPAGIEGEISTAADIDWFSFTSAGGPVTLSATPAVLSPNLDVKISLYNSAGTVVASADPASARISDDAASGLAASLTSTVAAGTYYVQVDGVGSGNVATTGYSDYASVGRYSMSVAANAAPVITTTSLPSTVVGQPYSAILSAAGGTGSRTWSLGSGALPAGLSLSATGTLSGTPTSTSTANFTLRVTDTASLSSTRAFTVTPGVRITSQNLPDATTGTAYSTTLTGAGGSAPYTWSITSGALPTGLSLSGAVVSGTTSSTGTRVLTIQMTDSAARTVSSVITLTVSAPLSSSNQTMSSGDVGSYYSASLNASGGRPSYVWTLESGSLPAGTVLNSIGKVTGTPTAAGTSIFTVRVTDRSARTLTAVITLVINPLAPTLTAVSPASGPTVGGTSVTITGTDLTGATGVSFGGTPAASFSVVNASTVTAVSPAHAAGLVDVAVTTPGGTTPTGAGSKFTFVVPAPGGLNGTVTTTSGLLRGAQVRVYSTTGATPRAVAVSAADGTWSVPLPAGTYEVQVVPPSGRHLRTWVGGATRASATDFVVTSGSTGTGTTSLTAR